MVAKTSVERLSAPNMLSSASPPSRRARISLSAPRTEWSMPTMTTSSFSTISVKMSIVMTSRTWRWSPWEISLPAIIRAERTTRPAENQSTSDRPQAPRILSACAGSPYAESVRTGAGGDSEGITGVPDTRGMLALRRNQARPEHEGERDSAPHLLHRP